MKNLKAQNFFKTKISVLIVILFISYLGYGFATGIDHLTLKSTTNGCSCHSSTPSSTVICFISGPDSVTVGETVNYTVEISEPSKTGAGVDIASKTGMLGIVSSTLHISNGELVQNSNITMTNHAVILTFSYTAPGSITTDSIWATGLATNSNGQPNGDIWNWANSKRINVKNPVGIKPVSNETPDNYKLSQNFPNPFNPSTKISYQIPNSSFVTLAIYDVLGSKVKELVNKQQAPGSYTIEFDASSLTSGTYFYKLETNSFTETKKMLLIK